MWCYSFYQNFFFNFSEDLVDHTVWTHWIDISVPTDIRFPEDAFLNIASGHNGDEYVSVQNTLSFSSEFFFGDQKKYFSK